LNKGPTAGGRGQRRDPQGLANKKKDKVIFRLSKLNGEAKVLTAIGEVLPHHGKGA